MSKQGDYNPRLAVLLSRVKKTQGCDTGQGINTFCQQPKRLTFSFRRIVIEGEILKGARPGLV